MPVRGIRGAPSAGRHAGRGPAATTELLNEILRANDIRTFDDIASAIFTTTSDLTSAFPAEAARTLGMKQVPLLCTCEIPVPAAWPLHPHSAASQHREAAERDDARLPARAPAAAAGHVEAVSRRGGRRRIVTSAVDRARGPRVWWTRRRGYCGSGSGESMPRSAWLSFQSISGVETRLLQLLERHPQLFDLVGDRVEGDWPRILGKDGLQPVVVVFRPGRDFPAAPATADGPGQCRVIQTAVVRTTWLLVGHNWLNG